MEDEFIVVGEIAGTHGVKGGLKVFPLTDDPNRFKKLEKVYLDIENNKVEHNVVSCSVGNKFVLLQLENINDMETAQKLRHILVNIHKDDAIKLPKDSYFIFDLIGIDVYTLEDKYLGKITDILNSAANDVYIVEKEGKSLLLPAIKDVVKKVDVENKRMSVKLLKGLDEL